MLFPADAEPAPAALPWTLRTASTIVSLETLAEVVVVSGRGELTTGLRVLLIAFLSLKWAFAWRVLHLSAGAALGLFLLQGTSAVAALGATDADPLVRMALAAVALVVIVLLASSLHAFPPPPLPPSTRTPPR
ncbi:MAG: hypothetical protein Q8K58_13960 [Acidimicrobiales bacterium]|nr:hypothetical protein [Acidimicrobiales bacterium]